MVQKQNNNTTPKKRQKGRKKGDSSRKSNASNYWAQGHKTRWNKNDILQHFIDMGYSNASIHQREGKLVVKIDKEHCTGSVIWTCTNLNRVGADGSDEGSIWEFTKRDLVENLMAATDTSKATNLTVPEAQELENV